MTQPVLCLLHAEPATVLALAPDLLKQLAPTGSMLVRSTPAKVQGLMDTAPLLMVLELQQQGWKRVDDYKVHRTQPRECHETVYHFAPTTRPAMYQDAVKVPIGNWAKKRLAKLGQNDQSRRASAVGSGFGVDMSGWVGKTSVYPSNVLMLDDSLALWAWLIKLFSLPGELIANPLHDAAITRAALSLHREVLHCHAGHYQLDFLVAESCLRGDT